MTPEDYAAYQEAHSAAKAMKTQPLPGRLSQVINHPGMLSYEVDSPEEYANDQRRVELLRRLSEYSKDINPLNAFGPELGGEINSFRRGDIDSTPYHYRGPMSPGAPLHTGMQMFSALPAIAYNAGKVLGNQITPGMYPGAEQNLAKAANTLTFYGAEDAGLVPKGTGTIVEDAEEARNARGKVPFDASARTLDEIGYLASERAQRKIDQAIPAGHQHYESLGLPAAVAVPLGLTSDMILDPYTGALDAVKLARAGLTSRAGGALMREAGMGYGPSAALGAPHYWDQLLDRLHGAQDGTATLPR